MCHYTETTKTDPTGHGSAVLDNFTHFAADCNFQFFQALEKHTEGKIKADGKTTRGSRSDITQAINDAVTSGVDVLNLSLGISHNCRGFCSMAREVKEAVEQDNVLVVAASGNRKDDDETRGVHCPALCESVVSVAGYVSRCEHEPVNEQSSRQWWLRDDDGDIVGPFCGWQFCTRGPTGSCDENRRETAWGGNVQFYNDFPDIAAPAIHVACLENGTISVQIGTSFAAPIVTAAVCALRSLPQFGTNEPTPAEIQTAIQETSRLLDDGSELQKLDWAALLGSFAETDIHQFGQ